MGCAASHCYAWHVAANVPTFKSKYYLILEDDVVFKQAQLQRVRQYLQLLETNRIEWVRSPLTALTNGCSQDCFCLSRLCDAPAGACEPEVPVPDCKGLFYSKGNSGSAGVCCVLLAREVCCCSIPVDVRRCDTPCVLWLPPGAVQR